MKVERNHLATVIFPQLRKLCESRGVDWGEVDFRWGVTDQEKAEGKVLPIVLAEVDRCQPYFIGLLGERYGQLYRYEIPVELVERLPWLAEHRDKSLTELEMLHGPLNSQEDSDHAFFYFRDPAYARGGAAAGQADFISADSADREKLARLKERIRQCYRDKRLKYPPRENYANPEALGQLVLVDFTNVINELFPEGSQPAPLDREAMDHEAYAQSRERVYIGRQESFDRLNTHAAANDTQPLVVLGESGSGKSALLANWVARYRQEHPDVLVLQHYIGATPYSADWAAMLRRLMGELKRRLGIQQDIPEQPDALRSAFPNWLYMAAAKGRVALVLDALNQLEDRDGAPDLLWLPAVLPENVRLIVSTLPGRPLEEINKRHWPTLTVELLSDAERRRLIAEYLAQHAKSLSATRVERITAAPSAGNPLYLRVLLDELRMVHAHEELEERIGYYLKAESPYALYEKVIARWEQDYEGDSDLVGATLSLLWAARHGLTETELLGAMREDGAPLPRAKWSPLFLAMSDALISRGGLLNFAHDFLRTAVQNAYLPTEHSQRQAHLDVLRVLGKTFSFERALDEMLWQMAEAEAWDQLYNLLSNQLLFKRAWKRSASDVKTYWVRIEKVTPLRMVEAYQSQIDHPELESDKQFLYCLTSLFVETGYPKEALLLSTFLLKHCKTSGDLIALSTALRNQARILHAHGSLNDAMVLLKEGEKICRQLNDLAGLKTNLGNQATILHTQGNLVEAMQLLDESERICRQLGTLDELQETFGNQALIFRERGDLSRAMELHKEEERIYRRLGDLDGLQSSLGNQGVIFRDRGNLDRSMELYKGQERICRQLGNMRGLLTTLGNQALILRDRRDLSGAMVVFEEVERMCRQLDDLNNLANTLINKGALFLECGNLDKAIASAEEAHQLAASRGYVPLINRSERVLKAVGQAIETKCSNDRIVQTSSSRFHEPTIPELRDSAANALKRGLWEAAETHLEKLLRQGESMETVAPDLITALLNAHETLSPTSVTRIETLLAQLESAGHTTLGTSLREKLTAKVAASQPKKPWWKFGA